jgi:hypothetical protein
MVKQLNKENTNIIDNSEPRKLVDFLKENIKENSELFFVSAYFTIYA